MAVAVRLGLAVFAASCACLVASIPVKGSGQDVPRQISPVDGKALYQAFCVSCHGLAGHADGPVAAGHTPPVPDLTLITARDGKFDITHVQQHIVEARGQGGVMPNWKNAIRLKVGADAARVHLAVVNLARHVQSMQAKSGQQ